jgi:hypothetical protein
MHYNLLVTRFCNPLTHGSGLPQGRPEPIGSNHPSDTMPRSSLTASKSVADPTNKEGGLQAPFLASRDTLSRS